MPAPIDVQTLGDWTVFGPHGAAIAALLLLRLTGLIWVAPLFSGQAIPNTIKAAVLVLLTALMWPAAAAASAAVAPRVDAASVVTELCLGLTLGLGAAIFVAAAESAGDMLAVQMGLSGANVVDPMSRTQLPVLGHLMGLFATMLILATGGHLAILTALRGSLDVVPLGGAVDFRQGALAVVGLGTTLLSLGLQFAAPVVAAMMMSNAALGVLARTVPQLNVLMVAFPVQIGVGLFVLAATLPLIATAFSYLARAVRLRRVPAPAGVLARSRRRGPLMADDSLQDKTEAPTPRRRQDAFEKGDVPRSQEVATAFILLAGAGVVATTAGTTASAVLDIFGGATSSLTALPVGVEGTVGWVRDLGSRTLSGMLPMLLVLAGTALVISAIQARGALSTDPLTPKWSRLDPIKKIPQIWGWRALAELAKSLLKLGLVGTVVWKALDKASSDIPALAQESPYALLQLVRDYTVRILLSAGLAYLVLALADYAYQIWQHEKQLKMSKEEIRKEFKDSEGDEVVKVRRRTMARQFARRRMMLSVPEADVVVTNPTHIAVALKYDPDVADAPMVVAMGERKVAERIKEIARENGVPLIENKPLARALLATARVGSAIPMELFVAVAEILAWVYKQAGYEPGAGNTRRGGRA